MTTDEVFKDDEYKKDLAHYRQILSYMGANVPIQVLCLPSAIENCLIADGCVRVYDLIGRDLSKIKGIGATRRAFLAARLDEFFTINL
jgi:hypothetical protein